MSTQAESSTHVGSSNRLWQLLCLLLFALNVSLASGILSEVAGMGLPAVFIASASAFGSTVLVGSAVWTAFGR